MSERKYDLDIMRIVCILGVIGIHTSSGMLQQSFTFSVPLLVMISGVLWLDQAKTISIKKIWSKNILRIVTAFLFWSLVYAVFSLKDTTSVKEFLQECITGHYHMWFCYMIVGVYMFIPVIRKIKEDRNLYFYFLMLSGVIMTIIPSLLLIPVASALSYNFDLLFCKIGMGYIFYFMLGDSLYQFDIKFQFRIMIYIGGFFSLILMNCGIVPGGDFSIFEVIYTCCIFVFLKEFAKKMKIKEGKIRCVLQHISRLCFGVYLVHALVLSYVQEISILQRASMNILVIALVFAISLCIVYAIDKIPFVRKYIL